MDTHAASSAYAPDTSIFSVATVDAAALYCAAFELTMTHGTHVGPRGQDTVEIGPVALTLRTPAHRLAAITGRELNPFLLLAEVLWMLAGRDDIAFLAQFSQSITRYVQPGVGSMPDAYGPRLRAHNGIDQLAAVEAILRRDPHSRRAIVSLWDASTDSDALAFAVPCNICVDFKVRGDGLRMTVLNRSNDLHIGFLFNVVQFGVIGEILATRLGLALIQQTHVTTALHVYTDSPIQHRLSASPLSALDLYRYVPSVPVGAIDDAMIATACDLFDRDDESVDAAELTRRAASPWLTVAVQLLDVHRAFERGIEQDDFTPSLALLAKTMRCDWWVLAAEMLSRRLQHRRTAGATVAHAALTALVVPLGPLVMEFVLSSSRRAGGQ